MRRRCGGLSSPRYAPLRARGIDSRLANVNGTGCPWRSSRAAVVGSVLLGVFVVLGVDGWVVVFVGRRRVFWFVFPSRSAVVRFLLRWRAARRWCFGRVSSASDWCGRFGVPRGSLRWLWRAVSLSCGGRARVEVGFVAGGRCRCSWSSRVSFGRRSWASWGPVVGGR